MDPRPVPLPLPNRHSFLKGPAVNSPTSKESRHTEIASEYLSDDDGYPLRAHALRPPALGHLWCRTHYVPEPYSDDKSMATRSLTNEDSGDDAVTDYPPTLSLPLVEPAPAPAPSPDLSVDVASFVASLAYRPTQQHSVSDHNWQILSSTPFDILDRGPRLTSILFANGRSRILDTAAVNAFVQMTTNAPDARPIIPTPWTMFK